METSTLMADLWLAGAHGASAPNQGAAAPGGDKVPSLDQKSFHIIQLQRYNSNNPGTETDIPRFDIAPQGVGSPSSLADVPPHPGMIKPHSRIRNPSTHANSNNPGGKNKRTPPGSIPSRTAVALTFPFRVVHHGTLRVLAVSIPCTYRLR